MQASLRENVRSAFAAGNKIEAIRLLREQTGLRLAEAKAAVESGASNLPSARHVETDLPVEARSALLAGDNVKAIKLVRKARGVGLKEAKEIVDGADRMGAHAEPARRSDLSPGEVPRKKSAVGLVAVVVLLLAAVAWVLARQL